MQGGQPVTASHGLEKGSCGFSTSFPIHYHRQHLFDNGSPSEQQQKTCPSRWGQGMCLAGQATACSIVQCTVPTKDFAEHVSNRSIGIDAIARVHKGLARISSPPQPKTHNGPLRLAVLIRWFVTEDPSPRRCQARGQLLICSWLIGECHACLDFIPLSDGHA